MSRFASKLQSGDHHKPDFADNLASRNQAAGIGQTIFLGSTVVGIIVLSALLFNIMDSAFGYVAIQNKRQPEAVLMAWIEVSGQANANPVDANPYRLETMPQEALTAILQANVSKGLFRRLEADQPFDQRSQVDVYNLIVEYVIQPEIVQTWSLYASVFKRTAIQDTITMKYPGATLKFMSWLRPEFMTLPQSSQADKAGVRTAFLGTLWVILITILFAFPLGVGASIYLEEYASDNWLNRIIETNIKNLAGVPSIIYGMLGLAIFVRTMEMLTSGTLFGLADPTIANGRTILSAGLTLSLLILPLIIINGQEAIRAVPSSLRQASFGLGATKWQGIWYHVLPSALPGIMTGAILAISRAVGETAPLVVVGASTYVTVDPDGPFSKFTVLPIQIYQWTSRPQAEFRNIAAAAIIVLLILLIMLNGSASIIRNHFSTRF